MDERDFVEQTDYTAWSLSDLLHEIEQHADMMRGASRYNLSYIMEPATALAARAEETAALRAELAALTAATAWRPVSENPTLTAQYQVAQKRGNRLVADHMAYYAETGWAGTDIIYWRRVHPLPPAPDKADEVQQ